MLLEVARGHACVAIYLSVAAKPLLLALTRAHDPLTNRGRRLFSALAGDVAILNSGHVNVQIDAIQQRAGDALAITLHLSRTATAFAFEIAKIAAWAGIHRGDQHELRGDSDAARSPRDGDFSIFDWLAHYLQCRSLEFRQLIEKENTVVRKTHFARVRKRSATEQADITDGVMGIAERSRRDE